MTIQLMTFSEITADYDTNKGLYFKIKDRNCFGELEKAIGRVHEIHSLLEYRRLLVEHPEWMGAHGISNKFNKLLKYGIFIAHKEIKHNNTANAKRMRLWE